MGTVAVLGMEATSRSCSCDFIDSTVIGALFDHARGIQRSRSVLEIVVPTGTNVARTLELVRMHELVAVHAARPTREPKRSTAS